METMRFLSNPERLTSIPHLFCLFQVPETLYVKQIAHLFFKGLAPAHVVLTFKERIVFFLGSVNSMISHWLIISTVWLSSCRFRRKTRVFQLLKMIALGAFLFGWVL